MKEYDIRLSSNLELLKCPHCGVDKPNLSHLGLDSLLSDHLGSSKRHWKTYVCSRCGGVVLAYSSSSNKHNLNHVDGYFPNAQESLSSSIPAEAREYLIQAQDSITIAPAGSIVMSASSIDAMLKAKRYEKGSLSIRIKEAVDKHLITPDMAAWAHEVRLDANAQRHADNGIGLPTSTDARNTFSFAQALAEFLFVLPARVKQGITTTTTTTTTPTSVAKEGKPSAN